jgi:hypothetical protein
MLKARDGTIYADRQIRVELSPCMPRVQAAFTIEMRGATTASTAITNALHGGMQTAASAGGMG